MLRLVFHCQREGGDIWGAIDRVRPQVLKTMSHEAGFWRRVKDLYNPYLDGRFYSPQIPDYAGDPEGAAEDYVHWIFSHANAANCDAIESPNEPFGDSMSAEGCALYDRFLERFCLRVRDRGKEAIPFHFGTGNFWGAQYVALFPRTLRVCRILGFHGYSWPDIGVESGSRVLRYREVMAHVNAAYPGQHVALMTEVGITWMVVGGPDVGYRSVPKSPEDFWPQLRWLNDRFSEDGIFGCYFQVGGNPDWSTHEVLGTSIVDRMAELSPGTPAFVPPPWPSAPGGPAPQPAPDQYQFILGFKDYARASWVPDQAERPDFEGNAYQEFTDRASGRKGILRWRKRDNRIEHFWRE